MGRMVPKVSVKSMASETWFRYQIFEADEVDRAMGEPCKYRIPSAQISDLSGVPVVLAPEQMSAFDASIPRD